MLKKSKDTQFRIEHICGDDKLVEFYTGFRCYAILQTFIKFEMDCSRNRLNSKGQITNLFYYAQASFQHDLIKYMQCT